MTSQGRHSAGIADGLLDNQFATLEDPHALTPSANCHLLSDIGSFSLGQSVT
jgi:hypothetical protein